MAESSLSNWNLIGRLLLLARSYRGGCIRLVCLQLALLGLGLLNITLTGLAIDTVTHAARGQADAVRWPFGFSPPAGWSPLGITAAMALTILASAMFRGVLTYFYSVDSARLLQQQIVVDLRAAVYEKLQRLGFRYYSDNTVGSLINRVTGDVQSVRLFIDGVLLQMLIVFLSLGFYLAYMASIDVGLTLLCLATTPALWMLSAVFCRKVRPAYDRNRNLVDHMLQTLTENVRGVQVVRGFARQEAEIEKFRAANDAVRDQQHGIFWMASLYSPTVEFLLQLNQLSLLAYGGYLVIQGRLPLGTGLIVFSGLLQQFSGQVTKVTNIINSIQQSLAGAQRVFEILDAPIEIHNSPRPKRMARIRGGVEFRKVRFGYQARHAVLADIDLCVEPGQCVAILGATGAGKTTLLNLIPRFYDVAAGQVRIDGVDVRQIDLDDLRRAIGIVFQETFLFSDTVANNIAFGRPDATFEQIREAAQIAAADAFVSQLPEGYDTLLRESGKNLSGGQRQRLAIARAVLRDPPILLLDDPVAAVDAQTEREILRDLRGVMTGRTTFIVAHRLSTLQFADHVIVLDRGRIIEAGSHERLLKKEGAYWRAARLQADGVAAG